MASSGIQDSLRERGVRLTRQRRLLLDLIDNSGLHLDVVRGPLHGWGISKRIPQLSGDGLSVQQGSLYPALHRLEQQGWIDAEWKDTDLGRSASFMR